MIKPEGNNDNQIIERLKDPNQRETAFSLIVRRYSEQLYWQIRRMVLSHDDANDLLQNTFIKAWTNLEQFRGDSKLATWLYRIAINETLTFINRRKANSTISLDDPDASVVEQLESDPYFNGDHTEAMFQQALCTLPEKQRLVFNLKYFNEMKYEEISAILGTSVGALKSSYHLAVKKIETFFHNEPLNLSDSQ